MSGLFQRLFSRRPTLRTLARKGEPTTFVDALGSSEITLIAELANQGLPIDGLDQDTLLAGIEQAAEDLAQRAQFSPFVYDDKGVTFLPFFTGTKAADAFCGAYCGREDRLFQFPVFKLPGKVLAKWADAGFSLVMDPQSRHELVLNQDHLRALATAWSSQEIQDARDLRAIPADARRLITPVT